MSSEYEVIDHSQISHMNLFIVNMIYRNAHYHNDLEFGLILKGTLSINSNHKTYLFHEGDIFLINPYDMHEISSDINGCQILSLQVSRKIISSYSPGIQHLFFLTPEIKDCIPEQQYHLVYNLLLELSYTYLLKSPNYEFKVMSMLNMIFYSIFTFMPSKVLSQEEQQTLSFRTNRLRQITNYIEDHYSQKLLLSDIAKMENLSLTYLSHFFKDSLGMTFQSYLNNIRFEHAVQLIDTTSKKILDISLESGFSDVRYLNKLFILHYGCSPKEYQKNRQTKQNKKDMPANSLQMILSSDKSLHLLKSNRNSLESVLANYSLWDFYA